MSTNKKHPPLEPDWQTGSKRSSTLGGNRTTHDKAIRKLGEQLTGDIAEQWTSGDTQQAKELTNQFLVGIRQREEGGHAVMAASLDAQRLLAKREQHPPLESGWQTGSMRSSAIGGNHIAHDKAIRKLGEQLTGDIAAQWTNGDIKQAKKLVEPLLVGMRQPKNGPAAMAMNKDVQRIMNEPEESGWVKRGRGRPRKSEAPERG